MKDKKYLIVIVGPTAVGKTDLCINLGKIFKTEIISSDSRQFFKEMNLGTAKPSLDELKSVKHHLVNSHSIFEPYDVKAFEKDVLTILENIFSSKDVAIMTGGSGLYIDAICNGFDDIPDIDPTIRAGIIKKFEEKGLTYLQDRVANIDPDYYEIVDKNNPQRLMRAIEVFDGTGHTFSSFRKRKKIERPFHIIKIGLERDREELYDRIDHRMDLMIAKGLFEEAAELYPYKHLNALQTVGYSEIFGYLDGEYDKEEAVRLLKRNSRRYAKRQLTWFRKDESIRWFLPNQEKDILDFIKGHIAL
ncbi:tRNA dimethylallyltransferase [Belliella buryatensis]|uniref:tRNA dimethylallyltransferase n=1 Tax=Belliella buryatensis TaxID=1500549 RepID=A0A239CQ53_9BACT|nr:tRNA (adenosine(37)-N6)-dimethylallyltransferase MiaA [Belliella buryatensis]SNS21898.1 tRNA dimethylallyltransferase [Belliella buryatensis]